MYILAVRLRVNCGNSLCMFESSHVIFVQISCYIHKQELCTCVCYNKMLHAELGYITAGSVMVQQIHCFLTKRRSWVRGWLKTFLYVSKKKILLVFSLCLHWFTQSTPVSSPSCQRQTCYVN